MLNDDDAKAARGLVTLEPGAAAGPITAAEYRRCRIDQADYLIALAGSGDPVLLLHGFPQTHHCWRASIRDLSESHTVVAADLRGYGGRSAPEAGPHGEGSSKREMALDLAPRSIPAGPLRCGWRHSRSPGSTPSTEIVPSVRLRKPSRISTVVVLPALFGPRKAKISPRATRRLMPANAFAP